MNPLRRKLLLLGNQQVTYLLKDVFITNRAAGAVNNTVAEPTGQVRTVTDTNGKISISGGVLNFATGAAANDGLWYNSFGNRIKGQILIGTITLPSTSSQIAFGIDTNTTGAVNSSVRTISGGTLRVTVDGAPTVVVGSFAAGTYSFAFAIKITGMHIFVKGGIYTNWTELWYQTGVETAYIPAITAVDATSPFTVTKIITPDPSRHLWLPSPIISDSFNRANGALGSTDGLGHPEGVAGGIGSGGAGLVWTGNTWTVSSNQAINTPAKGTEAVNNGGFDSNTTGWTASNATLASVAGGVSGNCLSVTNTSTTRGYAYQAITTVPGQWYYISFNFKNGTSVERFFVGTTQGGQELWSKGSISSASWASRSGVFQATSTTTYISLMLDTLAVGDSVYFDSVTLKPITQSNLFTTIDTGKKDYLIDLATPGTTGLDYGIVANLDSASNPQNYVLATLQTVGTAKAILTKVVNGTPTQVINASVTISAGAVLRLIKDGTSYSLYYNNAQVGSTSTISDAGIVNNTIHGMFSTDPSNTLDNFVIYDTGFTSNVHSTLDKY